MINGDQNLGKVVPQASTSRLKEWANNIIDFQNQSRQQQMDKFDMERDNDIKNNFVSSLNTTDHGIAQDCDRAARIGIVAKGIREYFADPENGGIDYYGVDDVPLVDDFKEQNPDLEDAIWQFVLDESQVCDPNQIYQDLGFYPSEEETTSMDENTSNENSNPLTNIAGGIADSILGLPKFAGDLGADLGAESIKLFGGDEEKANAAAEQIKSYIDKISFGDENSRWYKVPKATSDLVLAYLLGKGLLPQSSIGNLGWGTKMILGGAEGAADMALYDAISDQELPSQSDLSLGFNLGAIFPLIGPAYKGFKNALKRTGEKEIERTIPKVSKLTESRQDSFLKEFGQTFEEWMRERNLTTYDDVKNYFNASKDAKMEAFKQIKGRYKSKEVDDVLDWCVGYAQRTGDPKLEELLEFQTKNAEGGLEMWESEKVKQYFGDKGVFNFEGTKTSEEVDTLTNMYEKLMNWQRKVAKENGFGNVAEINNEIQAGWYLNKYVKDMTKIGKKGATLLDFAIAIMTRDWKLAASYLVSKRVLGGAKANEKYANLLQWIFKNGDTDKLAVDYEKIQSIQDEKELLKWIEENYGVPKNALPNIEGAAPAPIGTVPTVDVGKGQEFISAPGGETRLKSVNDGRNGVDFVK